MTRWHRYDTDRQTLMREQLERVLETEGLCNAVFWTISKGRVLSSHADAHHGCLIRRCQGLLNAAY